MVIRRGKDGYYGIVTTRLFAYAETLPIEELASPGMLSKLAEFGVGLVAAVRPWDISACAALVEAARGSSVDLRIWPMVEDDHGRWLNVENVFRFRAMVEAIDATLASADREAPPGLLLDLEMPHACMHAWTTMPARDLVPDIARSALRWRNLDVGPDGAWLEEIGKRRLVDVAVPPMLAWDDPRWSGWSRLMGLPRLDFASSISPMAYTTLLSGYSRGFIGRAFSTRMLRAISRETRACWGARSAVSIGCVGTGALGNETTYGGPEQLYEDARIARTTGIDTLSVFDLGGMVRREGLEPWLRAFRDGANTESKGPTTPTSLVGRAARLALRGVARFG